MTQLERLIQEVDALDPGELEHLGRVVLRRLEAAGIYVPREEHEELWADEALTRLERYEAGQELASPWDGLSRRSLSS